MSLINRLFYPPSDSFFLLGPRGTGKSTYIKQHYPESLKIDLLKPDVFRQYLVKPEHLFDVIAGNPQKKVVVLDQIQRAPVLLSVVHSLIEEKKGIQFILTGSSARKIKNSGSDLLGGRALKRLMNPFIAAELNREFDLDYALEFGTLPLIYHHPNPRDKLHAYVNLYLQEEVQAEGLVRNLENFARFLEAITFSHASILNLANVARECGVKRKTVENYITILEELLLAYRLPVFTKRAQREIVSHPKFYLFDTGVFRALRPTGPLDKPEEIGGAALEGLVMQHLRAWNDYSTTKHTLSFWRTRAGLEIDFIVYGPDGLWAIEVKNSQRIRSQDTEALKAFREDYPMAKPIILYRGQERFQHDNILCIPVQEFLLSLVPDQPI